MMENRSEPVPVMGSWRGWYLLVAGVLVLDIVLLSILGAVYG